MGVCADTGKLKCRIGDIIMIPALILGGKCHRNVLKTNKIQILDKSLHSIFSQKVLKS